MVIVCWFACGCKLLRGAHHSLQVHFKTMHVYYLNCKQSREQPWLAGPRNLISSSTVINQTTIWNPKLSTTSSGSKPSDVQNVYQCLTWETIMMNIAQYTKHTPKKVITNSGILFWFFFFTLPPHAPLSLFLSLSLLDICGTMMGNI